MRLLMSLCGSLAEVCENDGRSWVSPPRIPQPQIQNLLNQLFVTHAGPLGGERHVFVVGDNAHGISSSGSNASFMKSSRPLTMASPRMRLLLREKLSSRLGFAQHDAYAGAQGGNMRCVCLL